MKLLLLLLLQNSKVTIVFFLLGSRGAFCELRQSNRRMLDFYSKLGSFKLVQMDGLPQDILVMATSL